MVNEENKTKNKQTQERKRERKKEQGEGKGGGVGGEMRIIPKGKSRARTKIPIALPAGAKSSEYTEQIGCYVDAMFFVPCHITHNIIYEYFTRGKLLLIESELNLAAQCQMA